MPRKCRANDVVCKWITSATSFSNKLYLGTAQEKFLKTLSRTSKKRATPA